MSGAGAFLSGLSNGYMTGFKIDEARMLRGAAQIGADQGDGAKAARGVIGGADQEPTFSYDGKIGDRVTHAFNRFTSAGLPQHIAAGLTGNLMQESGPTIDPAAVGDNGNAFGSGQMNGPRRVAYMDFANGKGVDPTDFDTQIDWMLHEGKTTEKKAWDAIMATSTPEEAARVASEKYWRPGAPHLSRRIGYATSVYDNLYQPEAAGPSTRNGSRGVIGSFDTGQLIVDRFMKKKGA